MIRKLTKIFFAFVFVALCSFSFVACSLQREEYSNNNTPSIDFMQPWAFCNKTEEELQSHFIKLKSKAIEKVIIQNIAKYEHGTASVCYYDSKNVFQKKYGDFLGDVISVSKSAEIEIIVGTSTDAFWWNYSTHSYNDEVMETFYSEEISTIEEILKKYEVDGIYFSNEMYSNPKGYEKSWSKYLNKILAFLDENAAGVPLYISPFNSSAFLQSIDSKIKMWENFFKLANLREGDVFLLQDGFGALSSNASQKDCRKVYDLDLKIRNACLEFSKADFVLNIELFASQGYASKDRIKGRLNMQTSLETRLLVFLFLTILWVPSLCGRVTLVGVKTFLIKFC